MGLCDAVTLQPRQGMGHVALLVASCLMAACGVPADPGGPTLSAASPAETAAATEPDEAPSTPASAPSPTERVEPDPVVPTPIEPVAPVPLEDRIEHRFDLSGDPDELVAGTDAMWVKRASGLVDRIDPSTNEVVFSVEVALPGSDGRNCTGLGVGEDSVWACDGSDVERIDPATGDTVAQLPVGKTSDQFRIPVAEGHAWVLTGDGSTLVGIGEDNNRVDVEIDLGTRCSDVTAVADGTLWLACIVDDVVVRVDLASRQVTHRLGGFTNPRWISAAEAVWVSFDGGLARIDPASVEVTGAIAASAGGLGGAIAATEDAIWIRSPDPFLRRVDPATLDVVEEIATPSTAYGFVTFAFGSVWASAPDDQVIYRIRP